MKNKNYKLFKIKQQVKNLITYSNMPAAMPMNGGAGYAPADYSGDKGVLILFES